MVGLVLALMPAPADVDSFLADALDSTGLPGVSVVVTHGDTIVRATGAGHDSQGHPVTADTPMRVASVSKSFTAAAVLTLVEDGRLDLDGQVADLLPFPRGVTVRQLLNQTSGIDDGSVDIGALASTQTLAEYVSRLSPTLSATPGTRWAYSNVNYEVAARLVEVVSGEPFDEYVRKAVFEPLDMRNSSVGGPAPDGYNSLFGVWFSRPELGEGPAVSGAGAVVTTARDMGRWLIAQNGHGPFPKSMLATMHEPSAVDQYGMGWAPDNGLLVHSGNLWTYNAIEAIDPRTGYGYAVMTNGAGLTDDTGDILAGLVALTRGERPSTPGGTRQVMEWVLAGLALLAVGLGAMGALRARRWVARVTGRQRSAAGTGTGTGDAGRGLRRSAAGPEPRDPSVAESGHGATRLGGAADGAQPLVTARGEAAGPGDPRRLAGRRWWVAVRLVVPLLPGVLFALYPQLVSFISAGRTVLWAQLFYFALPLTVTLGVAALAGLVVFGARVVRLRSGA